MTLYSKIRNSKKIFTIKREVQEISFLILIELLNKLNEFMRSLFKVKSYINPKTSISI
jgi:hypothetical protein